MIEKWRQSVNSGGQAASALADLSKAFDCIYHDLLIAKLNAYRFDNSRLSFIYSYLSERQQITKINSSFSCWAEILFGVVYPKVQSWDHFYLTLIYVISFLK